MGQKPSTDVRVSEARARAKAGFSEQLMLIKLRDLIIKDPVALEKWHLVVDHIVQGEADKRRLKLVLQGKAEPDYEEAVLKSLYLWWSYYRGEDHDRADLLLSVCRQHGLNTLAKKLLGQLQLLRLDPEMHAPGSRASACMWFEVGEVIPSFTGREKELRILHELMTTTRSKSTESSSANIVCVSGLGGIGKSSLVRKYAYDHRQFYGGSVIWINAQTLDSLRASFLRLKQRLELRVSNDREGRRGSAAVGGANISNQELARRVYSCVCFTNDSRPSLFIFDNVDVEAEFDQFRPKIVNPDDGPLPHVLLTSRRTDLSLVAVGNQVDLDVLTADEAVQLLSRDLGQCCTVDSISLLADKLQRLPLALQQAIVYIKHTYLEDDQCVWKYLQEFDRADAAGLDSKAKIKLLNDDRFQRSRSSDYSLTTFTVWKMTLKSIQDSHGEDGFGHSHIALRLIKALAYLNPNYISKSFLEKIFGDDTEPAMKVLLKFSMISFNTSGQVGIHRLVQQVLQIHVEPAEEAEIVTQILSVIQAEFHSDGNGTNQRPTVSDADVLRECVSHGLHLFTFQLRIGPTLMERRVDYLSQLCYNLLNFGDYTQCLSVAARAADHYERIHGPRHESTLEMIWRTAQAKHFLDSHADAMQILDEILPIAIANPADGGLGDTHWLTMHIFILMARIYSKIGMHAEAIRIYDHIISLRMRIHGEDSTVLVYKNYKARALLRMGDLDGAQDLFEHLYEKEIQSTGRGSHESRRDPRCMSTNLTVLSLRLGLGNVAARKGELAKALRIYQEVEEGYKQKLDERHPDLIRLQNEMEELRSALKERKSHCIIS